MSITTLDGIIGGVDQLRSYGKASSTAKAAGTFQSLWLTAGQPTSGTAPAVATMAIPTNATTGAFYFTNPTSPALTYMSKVSLTASTIGTMIIYDRVGHSGILNGTLTTAQAVNGSTIDRNYTGVLGEDVEMFVEWYTATGATASNITVSYTNEQGVSGRTTVSTAFQATPVVGQMLPLPLASGDRGVQSVQSVTLSASTGTAGAFGITLVKRIAEIPITIANGGVVLDPFALGMPQIKDNACIAMMVLCSTTSTGYITGTINLVQG